MRFRVRRSIIPSSTVTAFYRDAIHKAVSNARDLGFAGPAVIGAALMHTGGYQLGVGNSPFGNNLASADRTNLVLPNTWIDALESQNTPELLDELVRPMMDVLWQAFDVERCLEFDLSGRWKPRA